MHIDLINEPTSYLYAVIILCETKIRSDISSNILVIECHTS